MRREEKNEGGEGMKGGVEGRREDENRGGEQGRGEGRVEERREEDREDEKGGEGGERRVKGGHIHVSISDSVKVTNGIVPV